MTPVIRSKLEQWLWSGLTASMIRRGWAVLWMRHFIASEVARICADPVAAKRAGFEVSDA